MSYENHDQSTGISELLEKVNALEVRIGRIEGQLEKTVQQMTSAQPARYHAEQNVDEDQNKPLVDKGLIESNIFEYGLAWFGSLVLLFGIAFLTNFARNYLNGPLASLVGYAAVGGV
ncbi:MAG: hypothetical protein ACOYNU_05360, partial [Bacteroidales bacterium]